MHRGHPVEVYATGGAVRHPEELRGTGVLDTIAATLRFADGGAATFLMAEAGRNELTGKWFFEFFDGSESAVLHEHFRAGDDHSPGSGDRRGRLGDHSPGTGRPLRSPGRRHPRRHGDAGRAGGRHPHRAAGGAHPRLDRDRTPAALGGSGLGVTAADLLPLGRGDSGVRSLTDFLA